MNSMDAVTPRRSIRKWTILLLAWMVGVCVFAGYLAMILYLAYRWF